MKISKLVLSIVLACASFSAAAGPAATALSGCFADNTTGKQRKEMARWVFIAIASHPDMKDIATVPQSARDTANRQTAELVTKLLTETCVVPFRAALAEGGNALQTSFAALGGIAVTELMSDPGVSAATQDFTHYLDRNKFEAAIRPK